MHNLLLQSVCVSQVVQTKERGGHYTTMCSYICNKLASLKAMLVRNQDQPIERLCGTKNEALVYIFPSDKMIAFYWDVIISIVH